MATKLAEHSDVQASSAEPKRAEIRQLFPGEIAVELLDAAAKESILFLASDEARAEEIVRALAGGAGETPIVYCPPSDALPGDSAPASAANSGQRTAALRRLRLLQAADRGARVILVSTGEAAGRLYAAPTSFDLAPPIVKVGAPLDLAGFAEQMEQLGYFTDDRVDEPGEVAVRGQVVDIYPADAANPCRIEVADGKVASIRPYDAVTQLTIAEEEELELGRVCEPAVGEGVTLLDHLAGAALAEDSSADGRRRRFLGLAADASRRRPKRAVRDICPDERWRAARSERKLLELGTSLGEPPPRFVESRSPDRAFLKQAREQLGDGGKLLLLGTERDLRFLSPHVAKALKCEPLTVESWVDVRQAAAGFVMILGMPVLRGFRKDDVLAVAAADLIGSRAQVEPAGGPSAATDLFDLGELHVGDVVVHEYHGVAVIAGLQALPENGGDAIVLRFAGDARRLVPVTEANRLWRYGADEEAVTLDKLDGSSWEKRRSEIAAAVAETARGLVALSAERMKETAPELIPDAAPYERFAAGFPFTETADQARAIDAVRDDLASGKPMDRLVVGDVGFGKTEVALRAAAIAALSGGQVALAAPTTVLARQHLESFCQRFEELGVKVAGLSRLSSAAERKQTIAGLKDGSIQVVIGTGAVAGKGVTYQNLALVVVDEEQRFGAADKAKLRALGAGHLLALSATPIPRTLQNALVGLQQMSVIATPPARRQPIRTTLGSFDEVTIRTALLRERSRGGQSFVVVPRIEDMAPMAERLAKLAPELEVLQAHGKLPAAEIDEVMVRFAAGDGDVLLATNIIEAGLDVPRANTMLVWKADRFGLSQLHQLRGRVGRGARRGQILLLTDPQARIAPRTLSRLNTLQALDRLGAGFAISARDLDMRGAGDLLSDEQSGHMKLIGVDLYQHLLGQALRAARGEKVEDWTPTLKLGSSGSLPPEWIPEEEMRLGLYSRLSRVGDLAGLTSFEQELTDRFGELPAEARQLLGAARIRVLARNAEIERIDAGPEAIAFTPHAGAALDGAAAQLEEKNGRWLLREAIADDISRIERIEEVLNSLSE